MQQGAAALESGGSDPGICEREYRLDGLFAPPPERPLPAAALLDRRVLWVELQPRDGQPPATPLARVLSLLLQPESQVRSLSDALREQALSDARAAEVLPLIPAIVLTRFSNRPLFEICEMVGITLEDFRQSRAYQEIFGLGEACGEARSRVLRPWMAGWGRSALIEKNPDRPSP